MSDPHTPPSQQYDSARDRAHLRWMMDTMSRDLTAHIAKDESLTEAISEKLDGLKEYQVKIRTIVAAALLVLGLGGGALAWGGRLVVREAVSEALPQALEVHRLKQRGRDYSSQGD